MSLLKTEAVILRHRDFSEADKIITLYSLKKGKINCIAKGVKKSKSKLRGSLLPFTHNNLVLYKGKSLFTITGADIVNSFIKLRNDYDLMVFTSYIFELLESSVPEEQSSYNIFVLLITTMHLLQVIEPEKVTKCFEIKLLNLIGYRPLTKRCLNCGKEDINYWFSSFHGGILCSECKKIDVNSIKIRAGSIKIFNLLDSLDWKILDRIKISKQNFIELDHILEDYLQYVLQKKLNSKEFLKQVFNSDV